MSSVRSLFVAPAAAFALALLAACGGTPDPAAQPQSTTPPPAQSTPAAQSSSSASASDLRPGLPPLPVTPFPAARPPEIVRAVYTFAADHPEVLSKVPCFCGCENRGHKANDDCFVAGRDTAGRVTAWDEHGLG